MNTPDSADSAGRSAGPSQVTRIEARSETVGEDMRVRRALPARERRLIGAWCFLDHFGPAKIAGTKGLRVGPHPHIGLQTVTWLVDGEVLHRDSLGSVQTIRPGELNLMTSGRGIAHSEESPASHPPTLHGVQLWIALPASARSMAPAFEHLASLPRIDRPGTALTVLAGELDGHRSPATVHSPLLGLEVQIAAGATASLPLRADFEHGLVVLEGEWLADGEPQAPGTLLYWGCGRRELALSSRAGARGLVLGGVPFGEEPLIWWNFVARSKHELLAACRDWNSRRGQFGEVQGYDGARLTAPLPPWASTMGASPGD